MAIKIALNLVLVANLSNAIGTTQTHDARTLELPYEAERPSLDGISDSRGQAGAIDMETGRPTSLPSSTTDVIWQ